MSSRRPSYAQTTSKSVSTAPAKHVFTTSDSTHHTKPNIEKWVKENINLSSKPRRGSQIIGQIKNDSERLVTVLRKGKVYISRPKAPGELNARERRKVRRALAREAKEQELEAADASDPSPDAENDELDLCIHSPGSLDDCIRPLPHDVDTQPLAQDTMQRLQDAFSAYNPFGPRAHQFPAASSTPTRPSNAHVPPDIHAPNTSLEYKGSGHRTPSPRTPSPSSLSYEDAPGEISLASPDAALYASRRPSLNVGATPFIPNRICPLTPRTPCRSRSGSMFSPDAPSAASGSSPEDAQSTNGSGRCSRRHSVALAAWEAMQRRLSAKYDTPEYKPLPLPPSTINTDVDLAHPSAPFSAISPNSVYSASDSPYSESGLGFISDFTPRMSQFADSSAAAPIDIPLSRLPARMYNTFPIGRARSGSTTSPMTVSRPSHRHTQSTSALPLSDSTRPSSLASSLGRDSRVIWSSSNSGSLYSLRVELGEDPEADDMVDLENLTSPPLARAFAPMSPPRSEHRRSLLSVSFGSDELEELTKSNATF